MGGAIATSLAMLSLLGIAGCERWELDRKMEALCKKDGGVSIYEKVSLAASYFDDQGRIKLGQSMPWSVRTSTSRSDFQRIGDGEYRYVVTRAVIAGRPNAEPERGEGLIQRIHETVVRRSDNKLLGEYVRYVRAGGDGFTFGFHPSSKHCPDSRASLVSAIFLKEE